MSKIEEALPKIARDSLKNEPKQIIQLAAILFQVVRTSNDYPQIRKALDDGIEAILQDEKTLKGY